MAVTLFVDRERWLAHVHRVWSSWSGLGGPLPVVKGNGYGLGRPSLAALAVELGASEIAVGTVHELGDVPEGIAVTVLTPALARELETPIGAALTVGGQRHVTELVEATFQGEVVVKLASAMRRYGVLPPDLPALTASLDRAGLAVRAYALHLPLATDGSQSARAVDEWATLLPAGATLHVSHIDPADLAGVAARHPEITLRARVGTALWHGDKSFLRLGADVLDVRPVRAGDLAGYRPAPVPGDGLVVMVSGGTAHGVHPLPGSLSPFHFRRQRLALLEPPHMHTSMVFAPAGGPQPSPGDVLDLQRPLTQTWVDRVEG
jgi:alanine racemase